MEEAGLGRSGCWLRAQLVAGARLQVLDLRGRERYEAGHVVQALSVALPGLLLRRLRRGQLPTRALLPRPPGPVLLYDEATATLPTEPEPEPLLVTLLRQLRREGCAAYFLLGKDGSGAYLKSGLRSGSEGQDLPHDSAPHTR